MRNLILAAASIVALGGCAGAPSLTVNPATGLPVITASPTVAQSLTALGTLTQTDIANALALSVAANDVIATPCYQYLGPFVASIAAGLSTPGLPVSGALSGFEAARIAVTKGQSLANSGLPPQFILACAPLVQDASATVIDLVGKLGITVGAGSLGLPIALSRAPITAMPRTTAPTRQSPAPIGGPYYRMTPAS